MQARKGQQTHTVVKEDKLLTGYGFNVSTKNAEFDQLLEFMKTHCERWIFQKEKGIKFDGEYYRCKVDFSEKKGYGTMRKFL